MSSTIIPPNDPNRPRWLLDLEGWQIRDYRDVKDEVAKIGYGIVSYTWGMWADFNKTPGNLPAGLLWKIPYVDVLNLKDARRVMESMKAKYVWWDWMCVPQGSKTTLSPELLNAKGEEVGKQMMIYKGATKSIVWLHRTFWSKEPALKGFLTGELPPQQAIPEYLATVADLLKDIQKSEPWLTSGWTLQEGVLLTETLLLDHHGATLSNDRFLHNKGRASVLDLTAGITQFAIRLAGAFLKISDGNIDDDDPDGPLIQFIRGSDENYIFVAQVLSLIVRSGLVAYTKQSPLYILAGKLSRRFSVDEDQCWALLGALELEGVRVWYNEGKDMDRVKAVFFDNLLRQYQWTLMLVAGTSDSSHDALSWPEKIVDGTLLPLGIYIDFFRKPNLPFLSWVPGESEPDILILESKTKSPFTLIRLVKEGVCRRYEQIDDGDGHIRVLDIARLPPSRMLFLAIADLGDRAKTQGQRCIEIEPVDGNVGRFRGVIDIWASESVYEKLPFDEYSLLGQLA